MKLSPRETVLLGAVVVMLALSGCAKSKATDGGETYCDADGCYMCQPGARACWPLDNLDCRTGGDCGPDQACTSIGCVDACGDASDCDRGLSCNDGLCVPPGYDATIRTGANTDTRPARTDDGDPKDQQSGPCLTDEQCGEGLVCLQESGECLPRCETDDQCVTGEICLPCGKCQKEEIPATCGRAPDFCNETDAQSCGRGKSCLAGRCHFRCDSSFSCPVGQACGVKGICQADANPAEVECRFDFQCDDGACINGFCHANCQLSEQCGDTMVCLMGICQPDFRPEL